MNNQRGFSLISVMIAMAIMSVITLGMMQMTVNAMIISQTADQHNNLTSLVGSNIGVALNTVTCTAAVTVVPQAYAPPTIRFGALYNGAVLAPYSLTVKSLTFDTPTLEATEPDGTKIYSGTLMLAATSNRQINGGQQFAPRVIASVFLTVAPSGTVIGCGPVMPTLPAPTPPAPPVTPPYDPSVNAACVTAGGTYRNGSCMFGQDNGIGNGGVNNGKGH